MKKLFILLAVLICGNLFAQKSQQELKQLMQQRNEYYFTFELNGNDDLGTIARTISVDHVDGNAVIAYANNKEFNNFKKLGYHVTLLTPPSMLENVAMWDGSNRAEYDWDAYPTYSAYEDMMYAFHTNHPDKCEIIELGTLPSGRKILIAHINNGDGTGKPKFLYTSTIHGDETTGWMLMLRFIDYLLENPNLPECANILNNVDLYIGPNTNPDGTYHGGNNNVNGATRYNANGVDMNRNYADPHGGQHPDGEAYAQETEWFMQFAQDNNFVMGANYHGGAEVMNYPWDNTYTLHADDAWWQLVSSEYVTLCRAVNSSYMHDTSNSGITNGAQWYMIGGGRQDYMNGYAQCREETIECSSTKLPNGSQMPTFWNINKNAIFAYVNQVLYGIHGTVVDAESKAPIGGATITLVGHDDQYSTVSTQLPGGDFHRPVKAGTYNVRITKNGYEAYETQVTVADGETVNINAQLVALEGIVADFTVDATTINIGGTLHFTDNSWGAQLVSWEWEFEGGTPATSTAQNPTVTYNTPGTYDVRLTVTNADGESDTKYMPNYISVVEAYNMQNGTVTTCNAMFYDDGGPNSNYGNSKDLTMTFLPGTTGGILEVVFNSFDTESNYDYLYIYDGTSTSAPQIGQYHGSNNPTTVTATNANGALTFQFTSDYSVNYSGWVANVHCVGITYDPLEIEVFAEPEVINYGETTTLEVEVTGGDGDYSYYWEPAETLDDPTSATPRATPVEPTTTYRVTVTDGQGTSVQGEVTVTISNWSAQEHDANSLKVYPNPTYGIVTIESASGIRYELHDSLGQLILSGQGLGKIRLNIEQLQQGIYFLHLNGESGKRVEKLIIEK
ncbi:MAG: carboxypeptidase regulatory-like domain-containing protein [Bacteroidales bacterium]|nr:carboxypeptidase regulatory-like domain-containing protein [Bacteroidales bacterium]